jgi:hypothetical protein
VFFYGGRQSEGRHLRSKPCLMGIILDADRSAPRGPERQYKPSNSGGARLQISCIINFITQGASLILMVHISHRLYYFYNSINIQ